MLMLLLMCNTLCFVRICASVYMWIVFVSVVVFIDSSLRQRYECSPRQSSPWGQLSVSYRIVSYRIVSYAYNLPGSHINVGLADLH